MRYAIVLVLSASAVGCGGDEGTVSWLTAAVPASVSECPNGGTTLQVGPDKNRNRALDAGEVASSSHVCNGADGDPSALWLVATEEADSDDCAWGGTLLHVGKDTNASEVLEPSEFLSTQPLCKSTVVPTGGFALFNGLGGDNKLSNPANWSTGSVPFDGDSITFGADLPHPRLENDLPLLAAFEDVVFNPGVELYGKKMIVLGDLSANALDAANRIELPLVWRGQTITVVQTGVPVGLTISGAIEGTGGIDLDGGGTLLLSGSNSYHGTTFIDDGTLQVAGGNAIPDGGAFSCVGGTLVVGAAGETIRSFSGLCAVDLQGPLTVTSETALSQFVGPVGGPGALIKRGAGPLALTGDGTEHTGMLVLEGGIAIVNAPYGATPVTVAADATLTGDDNVGAITVASGGKVAPGGGTTAKITASGNISLAAGSILEIEINGVTPTTDYDQLTALGNVSLAGVTLNASLGFPPSLGNSFTIVQCTGALAGTFQGLPEGGALDFGAGRLVIHYSANSVVLTRSDS